MPNSITDSPVLDIFDRVAAKRRASVPIGGATGDIFDRISAPVVQPSDMTRQRGEVVMPEIKPVAVQPETNPDEEGLSKMAYDVLGVGQAGVQRIAQAFQQTGQQNRLRAMWDMGMGLVQIASAPFAALPQEVQQFWGKGVEAGREGLKQAMRVGWGHPEAKALMTWYDRIASPEDKQRMDEGIDLGINLAAIKVGHEAVRGVRGAVAPNVGEPTVEAPRVEPTRKPVKPAEVVKPAPALELPKAIEEPIAGDVFDKVQPEQIQPITEAKAPRLENFSDSDLKLALKDAKGTPREAEIRAQIESGKPEPTRPLQYSKLDPNAFPLLSHLGKGEITPEWVVDRKTGKIKMREEYADIPKHFLNMAKPTAEEVQRYGQKAGLQGLDDLATEYWYPEGESFRQQLLNEVERYNRTGGRPEREPVEQPQTQPTIRQVEPTKPGEQGQLLTQAKSIEAPISSTVPQERQIAGTMFEKGKPEEPDLEFQSTLIPGAKELVEQDVIPKAQAAAKQILVASDAIRKVFAPASRGEAAQTVASSLRIGAAELARKKAVAYSALNDARKAFESQTPEHNFDFIDSFERGKPAETSVETRAAGVMHDMLQQDWLELHKRGLIEAYVENYFPHIFKRGDALGGEIAKYLGRAPLQGTRQFLRQRTFPTMKGAMDYFKANDINLEPISTNPVDIFVMRHLDTNKLILTDEMWKELKEKQIPKFVKLGERPPDDYLQINDKIARVLQRSEKEKGFVYRGNYYLPEQAATVLNNYLSPGLRGKPGFELLRQSGNLLNQVQLGLSAFHLVFTSNDAMISRAALGIQQLSQGKPLPALRSFAEVPVAAATTFQKGNSLYHDYLAGTKTPLTDALVRAGGRVRMDRFYINSAVENFWKALRSGNVLGAGLRAPGAMIEYAAKPIMEVVVPRQKLGVFRDMAKNILDDEVAGRLTKEQATQRLQEAWDSVDNRMGQLVYDNLFWNRTLKDLGLASVRSLGWNLGTIRELGGGLVDLPRQTVGAVKGQGFRVTPRMAYTLALPLIVGLEGAIYTYLKTGKGPEQLKDYYYPKTGAFNQDGSEERISFPSYMKDIYAYTKEPFRALGHKVHPIVSAIVQMLDNKDFYGTEIRNADDPAVKQLKDLTKFWAKQFVPFSFRNVQIRAQAGEGISKQAESFFGITPAPRYIGRTDAENLMYDLLQKRGEGGAITQEKAEDRQFKRDFTDRLKQGRATREDYNKATKLGLFNDSRFLESMTMTGAERAFKQLTVPEALKVWNAMTPTEKNKFRVLLAQKLANSRMQ
jgi:hypothetical protein